MHTTNLDGSIYFHVLLLAHAANFHAAWPWYSSSPKTGVMPNAEKYLPSLGGSFFQSPFFSPPEREN